MAFIRGRVTLQKITNNCKPTTKYRLCQCACADFRTSGLENLAMVVLTYFAMVLLSLLGILPASTMSRFAMGRSRPNTQTFSLPPHLSLSRTTFVSVAKASDGAVPPSHSICTHCSTHVELIHMPPPAPLPCIDFSF